MHREMQDRALYIFGSQLDRLVERRVDFERKPSEVSVLWPELKGHEEQLVWACGLAVAERLDLLTTYGLGDIGIQIIKDRQAILGEEEAERAIKLLNNIKSTGDY